VCPGKLVGYTGTSPTFSPAALDIDAGGTGFVYDLFGSSGTAFSTTGSLFYTGRIRGSDPLVLSFNGVIGATDYAYRGVLTADTTRVTDIAVAKLWADMKVQSIGLPGTVNAYGHAFATEYSLSNRILTPYTALLALEPGMEVGVASGSNDPGDVALDVSRPTTAAGTAAAKLTVSYAAGCLHIETPAVAAGGSLQIYDMTGRLVADLSAELGNGRTVIDWRASQLKAGNYVVRFVVNGTVHTQRISITR
jgi:hypothetical protein